MTVQSYKTITQAPICQALSGCGRARTWQRTAVMVEQPNVIELRRQKCTYQASLARLDRGRGGSVDKKGEQISARTAAYLLAQMNRNTLQQSLERIILLYHGNDVLRVGNEHRRNFRGDLVPRLGVDLVDERVQLAYRGIILVLVNRRLRRLHF